MDFMGRKFEKKKSSKVEKVPKARKIQTRGMRLCVWGGFLLISLSGLFAFARTNVLTVAFHSTKSEVQILEDKVKEGDQFIRFTPEIESFMNRFVSLYMNVSTDYKVQEERQKMLEDDYYGEGVSFLDGSVLGERTVDSASFVSLKKVDDLDVAVYKLTYTIKKEEDGKQEKSTVTQLLNVPFKQTEKGCRVISYPYFSAVEENESKAKFLVNDTMTYDAVDFKKKEELESYLKDFLTKYAENSSNDMRYMMNRPEGLDNTAKFGEILSSKIYQDKDKYICKISVKFLNQKTSFSWLENMTLEVVKKSNNYFVNNLKHYW